MKIRKNDIVKINKNLTVGVYNVKTLPAGTLLQVWKATKKGELYCTTVDRKVYSNTVITNESSVTKTEQTVPTVNVGDIFVSSWGYDQTNVDFYTVLTVNYTGHMQGICIPNPKEVGNKPLTKRILSMNGSPYFKMASYASASPWNGREQHFTEWA